MNTINEVKMLVAQKGTTLTYLAEYLSNNSDKKYSLDTLSKKLRANTIRYTEMKLIAQALNMEIIIKNKD
ncbi:MAG: hypothetical protein IJB79_01520 [Candidatus Gastranaerophilales bacterium]|nr:hypothetical protein [Candidatus Gastranaerophilales bacterium]